MCFLVRGALFACDTKIFLESKWVDYDFVNGAVIFSNNAVHYDSTFVSLNIKTPAILGSCFGSSTGKKNTNC